MNWDQVLNEIKSGGQSRYFADILKTDPGQIPSLIKAISHKEARIAWRAAWVLDNFARKNYTMLEPYSNDLRIILLKTPLNGVRRHLTRIFCELPAATYSDGRIIDLCFSWINDSKIPVAVKANAMQMIANLCNIYPELTRELILTIENGYNTATAGYKSRARKVMAKNYKNSD
jgi:hypothetical protein